MKQPYIPFLALLLSFAVQGFAQQNIEVTNPEVEQVLDGTYDVEDYLPTSIINHPEAITDGILAEVSPDSLKQYLLTLASFENRNTGSDTASTTFGMGAARRWAYSKLESFSARQEHRLRVSYLQFDQDICGMEQHRNVFAVLPGIGPHREELVIVEGHMDSRCEDVCDTECMAHGMEDNGSGTALVLELARVMSRFAFDRTLVFLITTGEEQGLFGAEAFALYCTQNQIPARAVYNNDIVGGIICGQTASPPGCPGLNEIDSINVRLYSTGPGRMLARFAHLEYQEELLPKMPVPTVLNIMSREDRVGRGGDHIPFRQQGFAALRFTSANEHGDGNPGQANYEDRQHTMEDVLGVDTDGDSVIDSFFVDFNYLARNAIINGSSMAMSALGPATPEDFVVERIDNGFRYEITDPTENGLYRLGIRSNSTIYFDTLIYVTKKIDTIYFLEPSTLYYLAAAAVDSNEVESQFTSEEFNFFTTGLEEQPYLSDDGITLLQNRPNPFDEATTISVLVERPVTCRQAFIRVTDSRGRELARYPVELKPGLVEVLYGYEKHSYQQGVYYYSLIIDGKVFDTKAMVYAY
ncbi:MAG: M28 family peptidase [Lewinellaceae bacterium]|nr:M28 family peptidase [Lewinellaceae bacterium]MCB9286891.1 M28 family peptidase [Lewinellaceae bacterium]